MRLYASAIFVGSFLLFQIQPMIAKMILPWFGGSAAVWITCMLFFQCALLLGYLYAHLLVRRLGARAQRARSPRCWPRPVCSSCRSARHRPGSRSAPRTPSSGSSACLRPRSACRTSPSSGTGPLLQAWYARRSGAGLPYRLFALSNLASLLGLLAYPFLVEPNLTLAGAVVGVVGRVRPFRRAVAGRRGCDDLRPRAPGGAPVPGAPAAGPPPAAADRAMWLVWSACGVVLLLSVTNHLTQNIAPVPFLWILPLGLYLLSFILCFNIEQAYIRSIYLGPVATRAGGPGLRHPALQLHHAAGARARGVLLRPLRRLHVLPWRARASSSPMPAT